MTEFVLDNKRSVDFIKTNKKTIIKGKHFISNIHPTNTIKLLPENSLRKVYVNRINRIVNSSGMFSLYLVLKENKFKYMNYNYCDFLLGNIFM